MLRISYCLLLNHDFMKILCCSDVIMCPTHQYFWNEHEELETYSGSELLSILYDFMDL